ncbi:uncharacterized protein LOC124168219 [Ischnura elegans]|uniref:uncharacterized protein LOC124168219 n=1 Tax=Ischnura elegans TaxID=197161 RepID=UPI001ED88E8D|nr:uncharacterized protein LOC124168219 [Ischnura elegans]XP_046402305.1 uncharacterized protein LOC124168219 [Ischnura elegans]XP_046402306.1 uncharacterized protein LOC124168219 [Ischnura elegans]XP_046402308.1 uncharacterized protein LOC124168219 [Ischnura elegans]XP_046402309.1 uncharacterized protein LOC124168219 [Ischnura elegans]XP_046402310.1 uncharacterized protein LOC124168219 [Ischnura elegans]XP_046402311.1 uncharacterized protein LOC124168219 [Ischnura elegans]XP_046402312.1 unc
MDVKPIVKMSKKSSRSSRVSFRQMKILVDYMSEHRELALGRYTGLDGAKNVCQQWQHLANILNDSGPSKNIEQWKKTWRDLKRNVRAKALRIKAAPKKNVNHSMSEVMSEVEEKCLNAIGTEVEPIPSIEECGIGYQVEIDASELSSLEPSRDQQHLNDSTEPEGRFVINMEEYQSRERRNQDDEESPRRRIKSVETAERLALAAERQAAAAERQAAAAERRAAAAERKALVVEAEVISSRRRAALAEAASKANTAALQSLMGMCERLCKILEQKKF